MFLGLFVVFVEHIHGRDKRLEMDKFAVICG